MTALSAQPVTPPQAGATAVVAWAVRCPGKDGEPVYVMAENEGQANELARGYGSFYSMPGVDCSTFGGVGVKACRVRIVEVEEQA